MRLLRAAATCVLGAGALIAAGSPAHAQPQTSYAEVKNVVQTGAHTDQAVVTVKYRCSGTGAHL